MNRSLIYTVVSICFVVGITSFIHFSQEVRTIAAVGLFSGGGAFGAGVVRLGLELRGRVIR